MEQTGRVQSPQSPVGALRIVGGIVLLVGLAVALCGLKDLCLGLISSRWPSTSGTVVSSKETVRKRRHKGRTRYSHLASIGYSYSVDGIDQKGDRVDFGRNGRGRETSQSAVANYPEGKQVAVSYWSLKPDISVLEPGFRLYPLWMALVGLVFFAFGWFIFAIWPKKIAPVPASE